MNQIKLFKSGEQIKDLELDSGREYLVGRAEDCDLVLGSEKGISRQHLKFFFKDGSWNVEVLSRFGELFLQNNKIHTLSLMSGMRFDVPPYSFEFLAEGSSHVGSPSADDGPMPQPQVQGEGLSGVIDGHKAKESSGEGVADFSDRTVILSLSSVAYIRLLDGAGQPKQMYRLEGDQWIAGRESSSSIFIDDSRVSRKHFEILRKDSLFQIRDLGSINGTNINDHPLEPGLLTPLRSGDEIRIVDLRLVFELHDADFTAKLNRVAEIANSPVLFEAPEAEPESTSNEPPMAIPISQSVFSQPQVEVPFAEPPKKSNILRNTLVALLVLGGVAYFVLDDQGSGPEKVESKARSPFEKLSSDQQSLVTQSINIARMLREQGSFQMCLAKLGIVHNLLPLGQDGSLQLQADCQAGEIAELEKQKQDEENRRLEEQNARVASILKTCESVLTPQVQQADLDQCLFEAIQLSPEHPGIRTLNGRATKIILERQEKERKRTIASAESKKLRELFDKATLLADAGAAIEAMEAFDRVVQSTLMDLNGLKAKAKSLLESLHDRITKEQEVFLKEADDYQAKGQYKEAITALEKALKLVRRSPELMRKHEAYMNELRKQMQPIYQESILEESVGDVDSAKTKWRSLLEKSLPAEEYYQKARIKLKKYGPI